jgi:dTDP-glucose 4,6-dehydratase
MFRHIVRGAQLIRTVKHIIFGGNGFVGQHTARDLLAVGEEALVCDLVKGNLPSDDRARFMQVDITKPADVARVPIAADDIVYSLAARMLHPIIRRRDRYEYFYSVDYHGAVHIVEAMERAGCNRLIQFSTDMVYGPLQTPPPVKVDHPRVPIGEYSASKKALEDYCIGKRAQGLRVSIFRPRLIVGPGRVGILGNLFKLIRLSLPVPLIGTGTNRYQMISVFDCASAAVCSARKGVVNGEFNLGSANPPTVRHLLEELIRQAGSKSILIPTPAWPLKAMLRFLDRINLPLLVPEQFEIADHDYVIDIEPTIRVLGWQPRFSDQEMMLEAYHQFIAARQS